MSREHAITCHYLTYWNSKVGQLRTSHQSCSQYPRATVALFPFITVQREKSRGKQTALHCALIAVSRLILVQEPTMQPCCKLWWLLEKQNAKVT